MLSRLSNNIKRMDLGSSGLSSDTLLELIGEVFVILHFVAHVNGDDLEFLLGSTSQHDGLLQRVSIWLVDFDRCSHVESTNVQELAAILDKSELTIPKARTTDAGYTSFKIGYLKGWMNPPCTRRKKFWHYAKRIALSKIKCIGVSERWREAQRLREEPATRSRM